MMLTNTMTRVGVPPIKCQGIKTKLVRFILESIAWNGDGRWIEPFVGSGVVLFNLRPKHALVMDTNKHIIRFYRGVQRGKIRPAIVRAFLEQEGAQLRKHGAAHYYAVRERFNKTNDPLDFLFLNRSCFNGVIRFNSKGVFNVPYGHKSERFAPAYITKIVNQIRWVEAGMRGRDWQFEVGQWTDAFAQATDNDFVYLDPPYIGRHVDYYNSWSDEDAHNLAVAAKRLPCGFALSMWKQNKYRQNTHLVDEWADYPVRTFAHFYHVGSTEDLRNEMEEALVIKPGYEAPADTAAPVSGDAEIVPLATGDLRQLELLRDRRKNRYRTKRVAA
jgi:DNA adenine methylase